MVDGIYEECEHGSTRPSKTDLSISFAPTISSERLYQERALYHELHVEVFNQRLNR